MANVEDLLLVLHRQGMASGRDLAGALAVSQPTLSRLVAAAGDRVYRMGRARATRYAPTRSLPGLGTRLPIYRIDEGGKVYRHGVLHMLARGGSGWNARNGAGRLFEGLPPFAWDMSPQGYMGRSFPSRFPEMDLPARITDWNDDHRLIALARRGEDCTGNLIVGDESLNRFLAAKPQWVQRQEYPDLAQASLAGHPGSSAGGEQPKFAVGAEGRHVLVKFSESPSSPAGERWHDLLLCERIALETVRAAGIPAPAATMFDLGTARFLEVERFDRVGEQGRKGILSLAAIDNEYFGCRDSWTNAAQRLLADRLIDDADARTLAWLDTFGQLIGNTDRHFGNISFFGDELDWFRLAPVYDMLPMIFAPQGASLLERRFEPRSPTAASLAVWADALRWALEYWAQLSTAAALSGGFRGLCGQCRNEVEKLANQVPAT